jgi:hypothetical protein
MLLDILLMKALNVNAVGGHLAPTLRCPTHTFAHPRTVRALGIIPYFPQMCV